MASFRTVLFRRPISEEHTNWSSARARVLPSPLNYDTLRTMGTQLFPPTRFYKVALEYNESTPEADGKIQRIMLNDDGDVTSFLRHVQQVAPELPIVLNVHHLRYDKQTGNIAARKIGKKVYKDSGNLGDLPKMDHPARQQQLPRKGSPEPVAKREVVARYVSSTSRQYDPNQDFSEDSDASVRVLDGPPASARPSGRRPGRPSNSGRKTASSSTAASRRKGGQS
ncbi:hypothetical protein CF326_g8077 [Tilletia indica]|nr:hypothetical protein CF326_g8077 [Tilletia indica]